MDVTWIRRYCFIELVRYRKFRAIDSVDLPIKQSTRIWNKVHTNNTFRVIDFHRSMERHAHWPTHFWRKPVIYKKLDVTPSKPMEAKPYGYFVWGPKSIRSLIRKVALTPSNSRPFQPLQVGNSLSCAIISHSKVHYGQDSFEPLKIRFENA